MATEKRLIDAYALMNQVRKSKFKNPHTDGQIARNHMYEHDHFTKLICLSPTVDAVEVVRCKDCKWYDPECETCTFWDGIRHPEHFCGEGARKDNAV